MAKFASNPSGCVCPAKRGTRSCVECYFDQVDEDNQWTGSQRCWNSDCLVNADHQTTPKFFYVDSDKGTWHNPVIAISNEDGGVASHVLEFKGCASQRGLWRSEAEGGYETIRIVVSRMKSKGWIEAKHSPEWGWPLPRSMDAKYCDIDWYNFWGRIYKKRKAAHEKMFQHDQLEQYQAMLPFFLRWNQTILLPGETHLLGLDIKPTGETLEDYPWITIWKHEGSNHEFYVLDEDMFNKEFSKD